MFSKEHKYLKIKLISIKSYIIIPVIVYLIGVIVGGKSAIIDKQVTHFSEDITPKVFVNSARGKKTIQLVNLTQIFFR